MWLGVLTFKSAQGEVPAPSWSCSPPEDSCWGLSREGCSSHTPVFGSSLLQHESNIGRYSRCSRHTCRSRDNWPTNPPQVFQEPENVQLKLKFLKTVEPEENSSLWSCTAVKWRPKIYLHAWFPFGEWKLRQINSFNVHYSLIILNHLSKRASHNKDKVKRWITPASCYNILVKRPDTCRCEPT